MYNVLIARGNLGKDPELKYMPDGTPVCNFTIANSSEHKDGTKDKIWFSISVFGNQAQPCMDCLHKGSNVLIQGKLRANENGNPRIFTKHDGTTGSTFNVTAHYIEFLDKREAVEDSEDEPIW